MFGHRDIHREIAQAVEDRLAAIDLDALENVLVAAEDDVRARVDRDPGEFAFVLGDDDGGEVDAPVRRDDDDVGPVARPGNVFL